MQIAPTLPPAAPAPTGAPAPAENGDSGFAEMLKGEVRGEARGEVKAEARSEAKGEPARTPGRDPGAEAKTDAADAAMAEPAEGAGTEVAEGSETPLDPALAQWLAGLHMPPPPAEPRSTASTRAAGDAALDEGAPVAAGSMPARGNARGVAGAAAERPGAEGRAAAAREAACAATAATVPAGNEPDAARGSTAAAAIGAAAAPRQAAAEAPIIATPAAAAPAAPAALAAPPTSVDVQLPMAPDAAGFGEAFATQVSVLARDGVQQAELHLNPAETGPVSIQIVLEGTQARIEFGADALPTRQAIEQSLPELAAALREEGLTLSGGGVSEHARGRDPAAAEHADPAGTRRGTAATPAAPTLHSVRMPRSAGGIDLYA